MRTPILQRTRHYKTGPRHLLHQALHRLIPAHHRRLRQEPATRKAAHQVAALAELAGQHRPPKARYPLILLTVNTRPTVPATKERPAEESIASKVAGIQSPGRVSCRVRRIGLRRTIPSHPCRRPATNRRNILRIHPRRSVRQLANCRPPIHRPAIQVGELHHRKSCSQNRLSPLIRTPVLAQREARPRSVQLSNRSPAIHVTRKQITEL